MLKFRWETEFKETEIGEIPKEWEKSEIGSFMVIRSGKRPKEVKVYGFYEVWGANGFMGYTDDNDYLENREVLITGRVGTLGNVYYIKKNSNVWLSDNVLILYPNDQGINLKFVFYHLLTRKEDIINLDVGSTQPLITQNALKNLIIPLPPLPEQSRIATVLTYFDDLIEVKKKQNEILEKMAMAIFKSWFVDFEPFRDGEFVYSEELGKEIPKGWEVSPIEKEFYLIKGRKYELFDDYFEDCSPYLLIETFKTGKIEFWTIEKEPQVEENDVVLVADGESSGKVLRYQKGILGSTLLTLKPKRENSIELKHLIYLTLKFYEDEIMSHRTGSAIPHLDKDFLKSFLILLPPSHILQSFHSLVEPLFQKIILNQKQIMTLRKIRDTLLPLLVFGKLRIEEV
jgi:type I restriction enzyme S subunit